MPVKRLNLAPAAILAFAAVLIGLWLAILGYLRFEWTQARERFLDSLVQTQDIAWRAVLHQHQTGMRAYFEAYVMQQEVLKLLILAQDHPELGSETRMRLYRLLAPRYDALAASRDLHQFHFHTPDGRSFLRFHSPRHSGDSLWAERLSIRRANQELTSVHGFEAGRVVSGFRNVYPILDQGRHLGSVELSQPFEALRRAMAELDHSREFLFLVNGALVHDLLFEENRRLYRPSAVHPQWYEEDPHRELPNAPPPLSQTALRLNTLLAGRPGLEQALATGRSVAFDLFLEGEHYGATLTAIPDIQGRDAALLLSYIPAPELNLMHRQFLVNLGTATVLLLILGGIFLWMQLHRARAIRERNRLQAITQTMGEGLYVSDPDGRITFTNPAASRLLGYDQAEMLGVNGHDLLHRHDQTNPPALQARDCPILLTVKANRVYRNEECFQRKDKTLLPVEVTASPMLRQGHVIGGVTVFRDVGEQKKNREALEASQQELRTILETLPCGVLLIDAATHRILEANPAACALIGTDCAALAGHVCHSFVCPAEQGKCPITDLGQEMDRSERILLTADGGGIAILKTVRKVTIKDRPCLLESFVEITALVEARRMAEEASRQKSEFLANMSHEIRTPLNGIQGMLQMLGADFLDDRQRKCVQLADQAARRLTDLLTNILSLSRLEAGRFALEPTVFTVAEVFGRIQETFEPVCQEKKLGLVLHHDARLPKLMGDAPRLEHILFNLVGNAVKFTQQGVILVTADLMTCSRADPGQVRILFMVQDTGVGITDEQLGRVFAPFTQADGSLTRNHEGAGLGLTVVKKLVRLMGGTMAVESEPGKGTTFYISLKFQHRGDQELPSSQAADG
jgi:two-component system, sensor histidine kinase and response regulator